MACWKVLSSNDLPGTSNRSSADYINWSSPWLTCPQFYPKLWVLKTWNFLCSLYFCLDKTNSSVLTLSKMRVYFQRKCISQIDSYWECHAVMKVKRPRTTFDEQLLILVTKIENRSSSLSNWYKDPRAQEGGVTCLCKDIIWAFAENICWPQALAFRFFLIRSMRPR